MIITNNPIFTGASGKLQNLVVRQYDGKTVLSTMPDMSRRKLSAKQKEANEQMRMAIAVAKRYTSTPRLKQRACEYLQVAPNKVFRAIVSKFLLTGGTGDLFEETLRESRDKQTEKALVTAITESLPDAQIMLFGERATGTSNKQCDWDLLVLTGSDHPPATRWELQEKLFSIVIGHGLQANMLLAQKSKWENGPEYEVLRKRIQKELIPIK